ncbi:MAG: 23S rRNA (uracil(1939)-C(5))-methyltransferase RlmD, partial [Oscillospiraceae bacterium]|nr:23S rRNA (uracil(1939)-C(5))-methyltransferase RlmD [Oscillospiraceae bacterium]
MTKNDILTLTIEGYTSSGDGVARSDGRVVFVRRAIFGETVSARVLRVSSSAVYARIESILEASPERREPACPHFGRCGGCDFLHMSYDEELRCKLRRVTDALRRIGGADIQPSAILPSPAAERYRNKAIFEVGSAADGRAVTGFYRERSHDIVPVEDCLIQSPSALRAAAAVREWMDLSRSDFSRAPRLDFSRDARSPVRHIFFREGRCGAQIAVVTRGAELPRRDYLVAALRERVPETVGVLQIVNRSESNTALAGELKLLYGSEYLEDALCGLTFRLSPRAFYQVNRPQAENLYSEAIRLAALEKTDAALDLYCGAGTITLALAGRAGQVYGAEISPDAIADARVNAALNGVTNAQFTEGDAGEAARSLEHSGVRPDVVVVDPPRKGLAPDVVDTIARLAPRRVVYISCDPATLARDIRRFAESGYSAVHARAFDMFPRCAHVETAAL